MKKIFYFASMMLAVFTTYSCTSIEDNPANGNIPVTIEDANGNKYETSLIATFTGEVGSEVSLTLGVYDPYDIYGVDFGDGKIVVDTVCYQNGGLKDENGMTVEWRKSATTFTGTVAGNGTITVYGNSDLWYLIAAGGAIPTSFDFDKLKKVVQMRFSGASVDAIDLNGLEELEQFAFSQGSLGSLKCVLTSLDLSKNPKLSKLYAQYNKISEIKLPAGAVITFMNLQNNQLESIDLSGIASLKDTYLNNNKLKTVDLSKLAAGANLYLDGNELTELEVPVSVKNFQANSNKLTKVTLTNCTASCKLENNCLTLATLPTKPEGLNTASKIKKFPQADMEVAPANGVLDLSAQATAQGIEAEPQATVFAITAGDAILEANKDYTIENGKITFLANFNDVIVKMTNAGFPNLTLATKPFNVTAGEIASPFFSANPIATWDAPASSETEITSTNATVTGGKIYAINQQESAKAMIKNQGGEVAFQCTNNNTFFKIVLDKALQAGDVISIRMQSRTDTDLGLFFAASDSRPNETTTSIILPTAESQAWVAAPTYTVKTDDGICGLTTFYAFRATAKSTYFNSFTITRK